MNPTVEILLGTALIASAPLLGRLGSQIISPTLFSFYDMIIAFSIVLIIELTHKSKIIKNTNKILIISSIIYSVGVLMYFTSLATTSSVNVAFLSQFQLVFIIIIALYFFKERIKRNKAIGFALVLTGGLLVIFQENINLNIGWIFALSAFFCYSIWNSLKKKLRDKGVSARYIMLVNLGISASIMFFYALISGVSFVINLGIIYASTNAILSDVLGILLMTDALKKMELSKTFMLMSLSPLFTLIYSVFVFGIDFSMIQLFGGTLLIIGNIVANKKTK